MGKRKPLGGESLSKVKRVCKATNCRNMPKGTDLARHYRNMTDFNKLKELLNMSKENAKKKAATVDAHTRFMFENGYSESKMPSWTDHKPAPKVVPDIFKAKTSTENAPLNDYKDEEMQEIDDNDLTDSESDEEASDNEPEQTKSVEMKQGNDEEETALTKQGNTDENSNLVNEIRSMIESKVKTELSQEVMNELADVIAQKSAEKTIELMKKEKEKAETESIKIEESWVDGDTFLTCRPCAKFSDGADVPAHLTKLRKGKFGSVEKLKNDGGRRHRSAVLRAVSDHSTNDLHVFCCLREKKVESNNQDFEKADEAAGRITIRNVIKTIKRGGSAEDFQADMNLMHLESKHQNITVPTKNNSSDAFFKIRDVVFEVVTEETKNWFSETGPGQIEEISVTLDKVTIQRTSFTALLTYFFHDGVIYIILNKLFVMAADEYDSEGTARSVVGHLMETLGLTRFVMFISFPLLLCLSCDVLGQG